MPRPATPPRRPPGSSARTSRLHAQPRRRLRIGSRATATPRRRALSLAGRARGRRPRLRLRPCARRGATTPRGAARGDGPQGRRRAGRRRPRRAARTRGVRPRRASRGARPVRRPGRDRRRLSDDGPRADPRRVFGDEVEAIRVFSPFTQRALRSWRQPCTRRRAAGRLVEPTLGDEDEVGGAVPDDLVPPFPVAGARLAAGRRPRGVDRGARRTSSIALRRCSTRCRRAGRSSRRSDRRSPRAGSPRPRTSSQSFVRGGIRVVVAFPHRGEALRTQGLLRRIEAGLIEPGERCRRNPVSLCRLAGPARIRLARARPRAAPDTQVFRRRAPRGDARIGRALQSFADLPNRRLRRPRGPRRRQAARLRDEDGRRGHPRLPVRRFPRRRPAVRAARADRQGLALRRCRRPRAGALASSAARPGS